MGSHGGEYECAATNAHGRHARRITVRVAGEWWAPGVEVGRGTCNTSDAGLGMTGPDSASQYARPKGANVEAKGREVEAERIDKSQNNAAPVFHAGGIYGR